mgnify:CR=1 FL=1
MKTYLAYGAAFSNSRSQLELNVREMAELLGISHGYLSKIETGFQPPNAELCKRLEHVAGIDLDSTIQSYIAEAKEEVSSKLWLD